MILQRERSNVTIILYWPRSSEVR